MTTHDPRLATPAWRAVRRVVLDRDLGLCQIRGPHCSKWATCVDHIVDRADGGDMFDPANLRAACRSCNGWRSAQRTNVRRGWRYRTGVASYESRL